MVTDFVILCDIKQCYSHIFKRVQLRMRCSVLLPCAFLIFTARLPQDFQVVIDSYALHQNSLQAVWIDLQPDPTCMHIISRVQAQC